MQNAGFLFAAFAIIWALLFGYVLVLVRRQGRLRVEIAALREEMKGREGEREVGKGISFGNSAPSGTLNKVG